MIDQASRWRLDAPCALPDVARIVAGDPTLLAVASGHEDGWSTCWPPGSRLLLDLLVHEWALAAGPAAPRLDAALAGVLAAWSTQVAEIAVADEGDGPPGGALIAVTVDGARLHAVWIGGEAMLVVRDGAVVARSRPHSLREHLLAAGHDLTGVQVHDVLTQSIIKDRDPGEIGRISVDLAPGDRVVLVSGHVTRVLSDDEIAALPDAEAIVERAFAGDRVPAAAAISVRI
jgi:serine/threonine protein phosphatase PrpC